MTTIAALAERARRMIVGSQRDAIDILNGSISAVDLTLTTTLSTSGLVSGVYIEIDFEVMLVGSVAGASVTVLRGMDGSTAAIHNDGAVIRVKPTFTNNDFFVAMQEELVELSSPINGLFRVVAVDYTPRAQPNFYDATGVTDPQDVLRSQLEETTGDWIAAEVELYQGMSAAKFATTNAIKFVTYEPARLTRVWYRAAYGAITPTGNAEDSGLSSSAAHLLAYGAAFRMAIGREMARSMFEHQGDTRRAGEIPPGAQRQGLTPIAALRAEAIGTERARLQRIWGVG